jgi:hypothetical protein
MEGERVMHFVASAAGLTPAGMFLEDEDGNKLMFFQGVI